MVHGFAPVTLGLGLAVVLWTAKQFAVFDTVYLHGACSCEHQHRGVVYTCRMSGHFPFVNACSIQ